MLSGVLCLVLTQSPAGAARTFSEAIATSDGKKLHSVLSKKELNGATADACTSFLKLVTKPRISKLGTFDRSGSFMSILDPRSSLSIVFRPTGGVDMAVNQYRSNPFEPAIPSKSSKVGTGFADLAFWAAHIEVQKKGRTTLERAVLSHKLVESWVPKFRAWGIKGSIESETKKYMSWAEILTMSSREIEKLKKRG